MNSPPGMEEDEEFFSRRMLTQLLAVVVVSSMFVLALYLAGVLGNARDDSADGTTSTTVMVAQMPPTVPSDAPPAGATDSSPTTPGDTGAGSVSGGTDDTSASAGTDDSSAPAGTDDSSAPAGTDDSSAPAGTDDSSASAGTDDTAPDATVSTTQPPAVTARIVDVSASDVRADSTDSCGAPTDYEPANAVDSVRETAWMVPGDGVGAALTITFAEPSIVSEVGLVPGYDKVDPCTGTDRFDELRRVTAVRWTFDDGTSIDQELDPTRNQQATSFGLPVITSRVTMTILSTTAPGVDRLDHTPVSEVVIS